MSSHQAAVLLFDLALIMVLAHLFGSVASRLGQPTVIGEMLAGVLIGPSLLGTTILRTLFPPDVRPFLNVIADIGVALFMFAIGLEVDQKLIRGYGRVVGVVSIGSVLVPFGVGAASGAYLLSRSPVHERLGFVLFMGIAMSVTAFPVLARILTDRSLLHTSLGGLAVACAAAGDVLAWSSLAVVVAVVGSGGRSGLLLLGVVPYVLLMLTVVRPWLAWLLADRPGTEVSARTRHGEAAIVLIGVLASAGMTEWLGLHFIFGAFLFGIVIPRDRVDRTQRDIATGPGRPVNVLMLPVFFVVSGMNVDLSHFGSSGTAELALVLLAAIASKTLGTFAAARLCRLRPRHSIALGILMNTRGLTELVILSVGLQLGVLPPRVYSIMVMMAVVTTTMAGPLLTFICPRRSVEEGRIDVDR